MDTDSLTILKYRVGSRYGFMVMDKFDEPDEPKRLDKMMKRSDEMKAFYSDYKQLWIKTCPIFPTRG